LLKNNSALDYIKEVLFLEIQSELLILKMSTYKLVVEHMQITLQK